MFCGSSTGNDPLAAAAATELGELLAHRGLGLVYGGATVGLMGMVADAVVAAGGEAIGVIPAALRDREIAHEGLSELHVVTDMHERKKLMYDLSTGFIALPGGLGTLEEVFEAATWTQLGLHAGAARKRVVLLDAGGFWAAMDAFLDAAVVAGFVRPANRSIISCVDTAAAAVDVAQLPGP